MAAPDLIFDLVPNRLNTLTLEFSPGLRGAPGANGADGLDGAPGAPGGSTTSLVTHLSDGTGAVVSPLIYRLERRFVPEDFVASGSKATLADGSVDATSAVQAALNALGAEGKGVLDLSRGLYRVTSQVTGPSIHNLAIEGGGAATGFVVSGSFTSNGYVFQSHNQSTFGLPGTSTTINAPFSRGSISITVASAAGFAIGDTIRIIAARNSALATTVFGYQYNEIVDMSGTTLFLAIALAFDVDNGKTVEKANLRKGLRLSNFGVYGENATADHSGLVLIFERDAIVDDVLCDGQGVFVSTNARGAGIVFSGGYQNSMSNVRCLRGGSNGDDAMAIVSQTAFQLSNCGTARGIFGTGVTLCTDSQFSNLSSDRDFGRGIKCASMYCNQFTGVRVTNSRHIGFGVVSGSCDNEVDGLIVRGINTSGGQNIGIWLNGESNERNSFRGVLTENCTSASYAEATGDFDNTVVFSRSPANPISQGTASRLVARCDRPSSVEASATAGQSIPASTTTVLAFGTESRDTNSEFASNTFTAKRPGTVRVSGGVSWGTGAGWASGEQVRVSVRRNGSAVQTVYETAWGSYAGAIVFNVDVAVDVGTTIDAVIFQSGAGARTLLNAADVSITFQQG